MKNLVNDYKNHSSSTPKVSTGDRKILARYTPRGKPRGFFTKFEAEEIVLSSIGKDSSFGNIEPTISDERTLKAFKAIASNIDRKIFNNYSPIQTLSKLRDTLLPKLMKGEIRVRM